MHYDMSRLDGAGCYRILGACVTPRPIAWVSSLSAQGILNVAPFSFFNAIGNAPPTVALGFVAHPEGRLKDTPANILATGEFVINLVDEANAESMNLTSIDAPTEIDEGALAGLRMVPSETVRPPRIEAAPVSFECRTLHWLETGPHQVAVIGQVISAHIRDEYLIDPKRITIDTASMRLISRLHGAGYYGRQTDTFEMLRSNWNNHPASGQANGQARER